MIYIDVKYVGIISTYLKNFKKRSEFLWNFSCPVCGDSKRNHRKARAYVYKDKNKPGLLFKCHNCSVSQSFGNFLKYINPAVFDDYKLEKYREGVFDHRTKPKSETLKIEFEKPVFSPTYPTLGIPSIADLPENDYYKDYIIKRQIPKEYHNKIFYVEDFKKWATEHIPTDKAETLIENDSRILFPFFNQNKELIGGQGRTLTTSDIRYITFKTNEDYDLIFGMDRINPTAQIYVVEGPIDSLFIPNCVAAAGSDLERAAEVVAKTFNLTKDKITLIFDNEPRNKEIVKLVVDASKRYSLCVWPKNIKEKDINDMILNGLTCNEIFDTIKQHTFTGLGAQLEINKWKKI